MSSGLTPVIGAPKMYGIVFVAWIQPVPGAQSSAVVVPAWISHLAFLERAKSRGVLLTHSPPRGSVTDYHIDHIGWDARVNVLPWCHVIAGQRQNAHWCSGADIAIIRSGGRD